MLSNSTQLSHSSRVLAVDDDPNALHLLAKCISSEAEVQVATSARDALRLANGHPRPDLILLDVMLPDMDGYALCKRLKEDPETKHIPVIFITAQDGVGSEETGLAMGAVDYIVKPFYPPIVRARIRNHLARVKAENEVRSLAERLDSLTATAHDPIIGIDQHCKITFWNPAAAKMFAYSEEEALGSIVCERIITLDQHSDFANRVTLLVTEPDAKATNATYETMVKTGRGEELPVEFTMAKYYQGEVARIVAIARDMSLHKQQQASLLAAKQAADEANAMKSRFLSLISHEMRTPLQGIIGMAELLHKEELSGNVRRYSDGIISSSQSLHHLICDLLDLTKIEAGKLKIEPFDFNLYRAIEEWVPGIAVQATNKGVDFVVDIHPQVPIQWYGDWHRLRQILTNICGNAIKFTQQGAVTLHFTSDSSQGTPDAAELLIEVRDSGIGIPENKMDMLFEPFEQVEEGTSRKYGGTGLGLPICRQLAHLLGGDISVSSVYGEGSSFVVKVPMEMCSQTPLVPKEIPVAPVVLIGLHPQRQEHVQKWLESWGIAVEAFAPASCPSENVAWLGEDYPSKASMVLIGRNFLNQCDHGGALIAWPPAWQSRVIVCPQGEIDRQEQVQQWACQAEVHEPLLPQRLLELCERYALLPGQDDAQSADSSQGQAADVGVHALVVDDNPVGLMVVKSMLEKLGCTCDEARDGAQALARLQDQSYDIVFMDCHMPRIDGYEAARQWRAYERDQDLSTRVPIVAITGISLDVEISKCHEAGMDEVILKPCSMEEIKECLEQQVHRLSLGAFKMDG